ncbi:hypothetical protein [Erwinia piriflorinigrans]|nr:hypothetical protein [Erwinia piriflorinigrans]
MIQPQAFSHVEVAHSLTLFRQQSSSIHRMANNVVQTFTQKTGAWR